MNKILILTSKFVPCWFSTPNSRMTACTHALCCPSDSPITCQGFSTYSSAHSVTIQKNSMPAINQLLLQLENFQTHIFLKHWIELARFKFCTVTRMRNQIHMPCVARSAFGQGSLSGFQKRCCCHFSLFRATWNPALSVYLANSSRSRSFC